MNIEVITRNLTNLDEAPTVRVINYASNEGRQWLAKHSFWALHNNRSVLTSPIID